MPVSPGNTRKPHIQSRIKMPGQNSTKNKFDRQSIFYNIQRQPYYSGRLVQIKRFLNKQPLPQIDTFADRHAQQRRQRHNPQAADLNKNNHHQLAEPGKIMTGINHDQSRYT